MGDAVFQLERNVDVYVTRDTNHQIATVIKQIAFDSVTLSASVA